MTDIINRIIDFALGNIGILVFGIFLLSGLFGRGKKNPDQPQTTTRQSTTSADERPLAERLAEYFGVEMTDSPEAPTSQQSANKPQPTYASEGRRSTTTRNIQDSYPELYGGSGMFTRSSDGPAEKTSWGFDENEWGSTFQKSEEQWGNTFPDKKSSEPRIEWPN